MGRMILNCKANCVEVDSTAVEEALASWSIPGGRSGAKVGVDFTNLVCFDSNENLVVSHCTSISL
jgi:hypothetical protein